MIIMASQVAQGIKNPLAVQDVPSGMGSIPGWRRCPGEGHGNPLQYSCLENPTDRGAWWVTVRGVPKSGTRVKQLKTHALTNDHRFVCLSFSHGEVQLHNSFCISELEFFQVFPSGPMVVTSPSNAGGACPIPARGTKIPQALRTKTSKA